MAGVAIFLLGISYIEKALQSLAGRNFKLFLKKQTSNKLKAIGGGAIVTALLQSSSVVNLLVLSLVGAGVIKMQNALALMMGTNIGTTLSSWIVATVGFKFSIEYFALPVTGITGIALAFLNEDSRWYQWSKFLFGISFLFVGLGFIKEGMQEIVKHTDLGWFNQYPVVVFVLVGMVLTAIVQASSATVAITLSALYANAISLYVAMAIVLGSEIGTTFKLFLASVKGAAVKKRVALGNFLLNTITVSILFILLQPINYFIVHVLQMQHNLLALVFFQTFVNIAGIVLFYPFLNLFGRFLENRFSDQEDESLFIKNIPATDTDMALEAMEMETHHFIFDTLEFSSLAFATELSMPEELLHKNFRRKTMIEKYEYIKHLHGEMHGYYIQLKNAGSKKTQRLEQLISSVRNGMYAAKSIRDTFHDIEQLRNSSNDIKYNFYLVTKDKLTGFCKQAVLLMQQQNTPDFFETITSSYQSIQQGYTQSLQELYKEGMAKHVNELEISTLINFNREMYTAIKSLVFSLKDYLLNSKEADYFDDLPGFIR